MILSGTGKRGNVNRLAARSGRALVLSGIGWRNADRVGKGSGLLVLYVPENSGRFQMRRNGDGNGYDWRKTVPVRFFRTLARRLTFS